MFFRLSSRPKHRFGIVSSLHCVTDASVQERRITIQTERMAALNPHASLHCQLSRHRHAASRARARPCAPMRRATIVQKPAYVHRTDARAPAAPSWGAFTSSAGRGQIQPFAGLKTNEAGVDGMVTNPATTNALTEASGLTGSTRRRMCVRWNGASCGPRLTGRRLESIDPGHYHDAPADFRPIRGRLAADQAAVCRYSKIPVRDHSGRSGLGGALERL